jgi:hypothetical protein
VVPSAIAAREEDVTVSNQPPRPGWARPAGILVGGALAIRRVPFPLVIVAVAATTAVLRLSGIL